jgi:hypothetical protein
VSEYGCRSAECDRGCWASYFRRARGKSSSCCCGTHIFSALYWPFEAAVREVCVHHASAVVDQSMYIWKYLNLEPGSLVASAGSIRCSQFSIAFVRRWIHVINGSRNHCRACMKILVYHTSEHTCGIISRLVCVCVYTIRNGRICC